MHLYKQQTYSHDVLRVPSIDVYLMFRTVSPTRLFRISRTSLGEVLVVL